MPKIFFSIILILSTFLIFGQQKKIKEAPNSALNLFDAFSKDSVLKKGWGLSTLITFQGKLILFDAGSNADIFKYNVKKLGVDLKKIDFVIISHAHLDHLNGIDYLLSVNPKVKIYFPFDVFWGADHVFDASGQDSLIKDELPVHMQYFNGETNKFPVPQSGGRFWNANIEFIKESKDIFPGVRLVATSASYMGYFSKYPNKSFVEGAFKKEDSAGVKLTNLVELNLSLKTEDGEVVFTGCSHSGVESIAEQVIKETKNEIALLYGGFHLLPFDNKRTGEICSYLKNELKVKKVAPAHCTGHLAFKVLYDLYKENYQYAGLGERILF